MSYANEKEYLAREQLRSYVEIPMFRKYLTEQILEWELWHRSQVEEIRMHETCRDYDKERLDRGISQGTVDPADHDDIFILSYEWHKHEVSSIAEHLEFRLIAGREPICFHEASIAAMVALYWCDINHSKWLVPDYSKLTDFDPFEPDGPFVKYLFEQWEKPIHGRYEHIDWFVKAAINLYESKGQNSGVEQSDEQEQTEQSDSSESLSHAALKAVIDGGLAGVLAAASKVDATTKHSETMMAMLKTDHKYYAWSADDWVTHLKAAKKTILATDAWGHITEWRLENKAKRKES